MLRVAALWGQILVCVSWFGVQVHVYRVTIWDNGCVQERYPLCRIFCSELYGVMNLVDLFNSLPTNDGKCRHDLCELSISLWEFIWGF